MLDRIPATLNAIHPGQLASTDADAIIELAQLVVDADGREGPDEIQLFFGIGRHLYAMASQPSADVPTFASDEEDDARLFELATNLGSPPVRELAYAVARALAAADLEVTPSEDELIDKLRSVLAIKKERADEISAMLRG